MINTYSGLVQVAGQKEELGAGTDAEQISVGCREFCRGWILWDAYVGLESDRCLKKRFMPR